MKGASKWIVAWAWYQFPSDLEILQVQAAVDIQVILGYNSRMLDELQSRLASWDSCSTKIGDVFIKMVSVVDVVNLLSPYILTGSFFESLYAILEALQRTFFDSCQAQEEKWIQKDAGVSTHCWMQVFGLEGSLSSCFLWWLVQDYLIMPVQRIPRYSLLLRVLTHCCS